MSVSLLVKHACQETGEGPHWDDQSQTLLYVDMGLGDIHRYDPATNTDTVVNYGEEISFVIPASKSDFVVGCRIAQTVSTFDLNTEEKRVLAQVDHGRNTRINDAKCDPAGRLWFGTMGIMPKKNRENRNISSLFSLDADYTLNTWAGSFTVSNGLTWSIDNRTLFHVDSIPGTVYAYDYDNDSGSVKNQRTCIKFSEDGSNGFPDGMTIDTEGKLWNACYGAGKVIRFDPETGQRMSASLLVKHVCQDAGEGPHWDEQSQTLLYVDMGLGDIHRYDPATNTDTVVNYGEDISFVIPASKSDFVVGCRSAKTVSTFDLNTKEKRVLAEVDHVRNTLINDGKCDPAGRLWFGTMGILLKQNRENRNISSLYSLDADCTLKTWAGSINLSNGLTWSMDNRTLFHADSIPGTVYAYDYDNDSGSVKNQRTCIKFPEDGSNGLPDGMTTDAEGRLWIACYGAGKVIRFDPETGQQIQHVAVPGAHQVTSCCFGGRNLDELFIVSAKLSVAWGYEAGPAGGSLYKATGLGVKGVPATKFKG